MNTGSQNLTMKTCRTCKQEFPESEYYRFGPYLQSDCKRCYLDRKAQARRDAGKPIRRGTPRGMRRCPECHEIKPKAEYLRYPLGECYGACAACRKAREDAKAAAKLARLAAPPLDWRGPEPTGLPIFQG